MLLEEQDIAAVHIIRLDGFARYNEPENSSFWELLSVFVLIFSLDQLCHFLCRNNLFTKNLQDQVCKRGKLLSCFIVADQLICSHVDEFVLAGNPEHFDLILLQPTSLLS